MDRRTNGSGSGTWCEYLSSLFNHSELPNVSYALDSSTESIRYTTVRNVAPDEELCIFYGHKLWFRPAGPLATPDQAAGISELDLDDGWGGLSAVDESADPSSEESPYEDGDPEEIISDEDLPFTRYKIPPEEEELDSIRTVEAWVVDIPDPRHITKMLKWLKQVGLETPDLGHLKRIRKINDTATLLLATLIVSPTSPSPPTELDLPPPYTLLVPSAPALTPISLKIKSTFWPTIFTPPRKGEAEDWTRGQAHWAWKAMRTVVAAAREAQSQGEMPIAAHVAVPYNKNATIWPSTSLAFTACDHRLTSAHPLRHAVINVIRKMADFQASSSTPSSVPSMVPSVSVSPGPAMSIPEKVDEVPETEEEARNGSNYLLTTLTVFTTHEPCIMCSMALIHSRVKEVIYLRPMPRTGGCGGVACLPTLKGVNHRFGICQWKETFTAKDLRVSDTLDA
ncbi:hypothetical protein H0H87_008277 [Tephrocybe sp. NHM501043]|nr:hypothetical protein H0H87_008277 [Tephrocybe sp. NHM501043]